MYASFVWGILTVLGFSLVISVLFLAKARGTFLEKVLAVPCMGMTPGCWFFPLGTLLSYLLGSPSNQQMYWLTITLFLSVSCLVASMLQEINPAKFLKTDVYISFGSALIVTALFICLPYAMTKMILAFATFGLLAYNLWLQNGGKIKGMFNLYNYRFLEDCIFIYFFPVPLLIFFTVTCFV